MLKIIASIVGGLAAGFAIATWWPSEEVPLGGDVAFSGDSDERLVQLEHALRDESAERAELERRVQELADELTALSAATAPAETQSPPARNEDPALSAAVLAATEVAEEPPAVGPGGRRMFGPRAFAEADRSEQVAWLVDAGFSADRAEWVSRRAAELRMQALQAQYDARRGGTQVEGRLVNPESTLRSEIGDSEYEQYRRALGLPTSVGVRNVLASSPAETAGLRAGDEIVSYAGTRVFDMGDLNRLTFEGNAGQPVLVDVLRDGQRMQLVLPRGPVGITGGGRFGGRP
jgi:membrane-associated protease RseP (regulator of RpoE activity)